MNVIWPRELGKLIKNQSWVSNLNFNIFRDWSGLQGPVRRSRVVRIICILAHLKLNWSHIKSMLHHIQVFIKKSIRIIYLEINLAKKRIIILGKLNQIILINLLIDFNPNLMLPPMAKEWFTIWYYPLVMLHNLCILNLSGVRAPGGNFVRFPHEAAKGQR